ncbi:M28 family peptidase [Luteolibacter sp. Populi]|uniref:M28 family peptidase n=1 Tax=Luteolibacter sp. Populi TaxID=3230487 RepID=UPI003466D516
MKRAPIVLLLLVLTVAAWFFLKPKPPEPIGTGARLTFTALPDLAEKFSGDHAYAQVKAITAFGPRPPASENYGKVMAYLEAEFAKSGWTTARQTFTRVTPRGPVNFCNLLARHGTADWTKSLPVVIGGHIDSKDLPAFHFIGANDGGSSTGVIVELARVLATDPQAAGQVELVLFDGEEALLGSLTHADGLYGSKYYALELSKRSTWPAIGIVLDLVGDKKYPIQSNPDAPAHFSDAVKSAAKDSGFDLTSYPGQILDDHIPLQGTKLPTLHLIGDFTQMPYWHQAGDTLEVIDPAALEQTGRTVLRFLARVKGS